MNDTVEVPVFANDGLQDTSQDESQPSTDKANASPEQKKAYALDKRFSKLTGDIKSRDTALANKDKDLEVSASKNAELEARIAELSAPKAPNADLELDNPDEFKRQNDVFNAHTITKGQNAAVERAKVELRQEIAAERKQEQLNVETEKFNQKADAHIKKGEAIGLSEEDMIVSANVLANVGVSNDVQDFIFDDPEGPQIADFLANNPKELEAMVELSTTGQISHIERVVRAQAVSNKPTVSGAPNPLLNIKGGGMQEQDDFDKLCPGAEFK